MSDNIELNAGSGGAIIATDQDVGLAQHQYVKVEWGPDNTQTKVDTGASALPIQDGGNSITVDGTVAVSGTVTVNGSGVTQPVSAASLPLPTGASTAAKQPALGTAGTASADVITVQGIAAMTPLLVNASGNAVPVTDNSGSLTVDNAGTFATQAAQSGTWNITNVSGTISLPTGASTAAKQPALGTAGTASTDVITVQGIASMTALKVDGSAVTQPVSGTFWQATQPVSLASVPSHAVTNAGTFVVQENGAALTSLQLIDDGIATTASAIPTKGMAAAGTDGTNARIIKTDTNGELQVDVLTMPTTAVSQSGTWTVQPGNTANTTAWKVDGSAVTQPVSMATNQPVGTIAHDGVDSGNPLKVGFKAETSPKGITLVADGDRTDGYADADGLQLVKLNTSGADAISEAVSNTDGASTAFTNFGAVASTKNYITAYTAFRTDAGTSMAYVDLRDGTAGSVLWRIPLPPTGGAISPPYNGPCLFKTSANTALAFDVSSALTTVYINVSGYQSKV